MDSFIDENRDELGVEPICRVLQMAPSTYYAQKRRAEQPSERARRDAVLVPILLSLWFANRKVYGAHKALEGSEAGRLYVRRSGIVPSPGS